MHLEIAEHFVGAATDRMTPHASAFSEEHNSAAFFRDTHCPCFASREMIDGCIREHQRELEFGDGLPEHREIDRATGSHTAE